MKEPTFSNTLPDDSYVPNFKGTEMFSKQIAKEIWFIGRNSLNCPNCAKLTRMSRVHCDKCGVHMGIPTTLFNRVLRNLMSRK